MLAGTQNPVGSTQNPVGYTQNLVGSNKFFVGANKCFVGANSPTGVRQVSDRRPTGRPTGIEKAL